VRQQGRDRLTGRSATLHTVFRRPLANLHSASTTEIPAAQPVASPAAVSRERSGGLRALTPGRFYLGLIVVAVVIGAISLLIPSTPSYDPWAWIVWGREIVHLDLQTTGGPSWKPLPMIFTTLFSPFGQAEPDLWLAIARAGAFAAVVMTARLAFRLTRLIGSRMGAAGQAPLAPAVLAGAIGAAGLAFSGGFISDNALGYSEGLAAAAILIAIERHLDGAPRQAFAVGFLAALDRPEIWLFWGPYGLWLWWRDPGARKLVAALFVLIPVLWFAPEYWGSGHFLRGATRAQHPRANSPAFATCPFCTELTDHAWPTVLVRLKVAAVILAGFVLAAILRVSRTAGRGALRGARPRAQATTVAVGLLGIAWFVVVAIMTQAGFSGNNRYLVIGSALIDVCGAVAWGWAVAELVALAGSERLGAKRPPAAVAWVAAVLAGALFVFLSPGLIGPNRYKLARTHGSLNYQARLRAGAQGVIAAYGGAAKLLRCGTVMTEGFQVPLVSWYLGVHTLTVTSPAPAGAPLGPAPNVIMQTRSQRHHALLPIVRAWPSVHYTYAGHSGPFRLFTHCRA